MSQQVTRLSLQTTGFPLLSSFSGRSVLIPAADTQPTAEEPASYMVKPQVIFAENVLPTKEGFRTLRYNQFRAGTVGVVALETWIFSGDTESVLRNTPITEPTQRQSIGVINQNTIDVYDPATLLWTEATDWRFDATGVYASTGPYAIEVPARKVTHAVINGQSYICREGKDIGAVHIPDGKIYDRPVIRPSQDGCSWANNSNTLTVPGAWLAGWEAGMEISTPAGSIPSTPPTTIVSVVGDTVTISALTTAASVAGGSTVEVTSVMAIKGLRWPYFAAHLDILTGVTFGATRDILNLPVSYADAHGIQIGQAATHALLAAGTTVLDVITSSTQITVKLSAAFSGVAPPAGLLIVAAPEFDTALPIDPAAVPRILANGITASCGYMIAWNKHEIFWSSPLNELDFVPSLTTGAGSDVPIDLGGEIIVCYPVTNGFLIFTTGNIIAAQFTGNVSNPWMYNAIAGSGYIRSDEAVSHDMVDDTQYAWTTEGLLHISARSHTPASPVAPEISDFLASKKYETFSALTGAITAISRPAAWDTVVRVTRIGQRYVVISYGLYNPAAVPGGTARTEVCSHALIYDVALKRWGKIALDHMDVFAMPSPQVNPLEQIAFLEATGGIKVLSQLGINALDGTIVLGRISTTRSSANTLLMATIEQVVDGTVPVVWASRMLNGVTASAAVAPAVLDTASGFRRYGFRQTALSHLLSFTGQFHATEVTITTTQNGDR